MQVITFEAGVEDTCSLHRPFSTRTWTCPDSNDRVCLQTSYTGNVLSQKTTLYYNMGWLWEYKGDHTPETVWSHMAELLLEYDILCVPIQETLELSLPDLSAVEMDYGLHTKQDE